MRNNRFQVLLPSGQRVNLKVTATNGKECKPEHAKEARSMFVDGERWNETKKVQRPESPNTTDLFCREVLKDPKLRPIQVGSKVRFTGHGKLVNTGATGKVLSITSSGAEVQFDRLEMLKYSVPLNRRVTICNLRTLELIDLQKDLDNEATRYIRKLEKENEELRTKLTFSGTQDQSAEIEQLKAKVENLNAKLRDTYRENEVFRNEMTDAQNRTEEERESRVQMECGILNIIRKMGQS